MHKRYMVFDDNWYAYVKTFSAGLRSILIVISFTFSFFLIHLRYGSGYDVVIYFITTNDRLINFNKRSYQFSLNHTYVKAHSRSGNDGGSSYLNGTKSPRDVPATSLGRKEVLWMSLKRSWNICAIWVISKGHAASSIKQFLLMKRWYWVFAKIHAVRAHTHIHTPRKGGTSSKTKTHFERCLSTDMTNSKDDIVTSTTDVVGAAEANRESAWIRGIRWAWPKGRTEVDDVSICRYR